MNRKWLWALGGAVVGMIVAPLVRAKLPFRLPSVGG